jgi:hypothetical protein
MNWHELFLIFLVLAGAVGWEPLRVRGRPGLAFGWLLGCAAIAGFLAVRWNIASGI